MKKLFTLNLLLLVLAVFVLSACGDDDDKIETTGEFTVGEETTKIGSGVFIYSTVEREDVNEDTYYSNQLALLSKGLKIVSEDGEYEIEGDGSLLLIELNNEGQELQEGEYTWQSGEDEFPFELTEGEVVLNVNSDSEETYYLYSGTLTVSKSGSKYNITFDGTAYLAFDAARGLPPVAVTAEFEGKLKEASIDF